MILILRCIRDVFSATQVTSSDSDENDYDAKRDRPLPYTRPSVDPIPNDCTTKASEINL